MTIIDTDRRSGSSEPFPHAGRKGLEENDLDKGLDPFSVRVEIVCECYINGPSIPDAVILCRQPPCHPSNQLFRNGAQNNLTLG